MTDAELLTVYDDAAPLPDDHLAGLRAVERAARAAEREACALVCEETTAAWTQPVYNSACMDCATAIRNRDAARDALREAARMALSLIEKAEEEPLWPDYGRLVDRARDLLREALK